ncbi:MAG: glycosyltransferase family 39 protein [Anaerolineae bacterium]
MTAIHRRGIEPSATEIPPTPEGTASGETQAATPSAGRRVFGSDGLNLQRWFLLILLAILLLAAGERILHIGDQSMWLDEGYAYWNQKQPNIITWLATHERHPPLYFMLLHLWIGVTGSSVVGLRMFSALASLISVAAVVPLAKLLRRSRSRAEYLLIPILAALLLALNDSEISLAQEVRMYALRTLLALGSVFFYIYWARRPSVKRGLLWAITLAALYHTHYLGLYMPVIEGLHALIFLRGRRRLAAIGWLALSGALFAPWFILYGFGQRNVDPGVGSFLVTSWETARDLGFKYFSQMWPLMIGLLLFGLVRYTDDQRIKWRPFGTSFLMATWIAFTVVVTFVVNLWVDVLSPRRLMLVTPALAILTARGLANFRNPARIFLVGVIVIYGLATVDDYYPKTPWNKVAQNLVAYAHPDELVLMEIYRDDVTMDYYIDTMLSLDTPRESLRMWREDRAAEYPDALIAEIDQHDAVWLVHWSPDQSAFRFLAQTGHVQTAKLSVDHIGNSLDLYRFDRLPASPVETFANGMTLRKFEILPDDSRVDLWWSADAPLDRDYTTSVFVLNDAGQLVAQYDAYPFENRRPTTGWQPGEVVYDPHPLDLSAVAPGQYTVAVQIYTWQDQVNQPTASGDQWLVLGEMTR